MKNSNYLRNIAIFISLLIISIPFIQAQEVNYVLDQNGNLIMGDNLFREYDDFNQLVRIREGNLSTSKVLEEYVWHPVEEKIAIKRVFFNNTLNYTVYYIDENYIIVKNSSGTFKEKYIYQDGILVAQVNSDGKKLAVHTDVEGSTSFITNGSGNVTVNTTYSPFGEILSGGRDSRFDSEGKEFDSSTRTYDFGFRQFDPNIHIWQKPDTLIQNVYDPQSLNRFAFERNNPYKYTDPDGHHACSLPQYYCVDVPVKYIIGGLFAAAVATYYYFAQNDANEASYEQTAPPPPRPLDNILQDYFETLQLMHKWENVISDAGFAYDILDPNNHDKSPFNSAFSPVGIAPSVDRGWAYQFARDYILPFYIGSSQRDFVNDVRSLSSGNVRLSWSGEITINNGGSFGSLKCESTCSAFAGTKAERDRARNSNRGSRGSANGIKEDLGSGCRLNCAARDKIRK